MEHESDSGASLLAERARHHGFELHVVTPTTAIPRSAAGYAAVMAMGASASVNDAAIDAWFADELALLRDADARGVPVLAVCFGAQALAVALGGSVARASRPEVGWFGVDTTRPDLIEPGPWFEWHADAITPPAAATVLATTGVCVQAYAIGPHLAVQFHPEVTTVEVGSWAAGGAPELVPLGLVGDTLVDETRRCAPEARERADRLFDRFLAYAGLLASPPATA